MSDDAGGANARSVREIRIEGYTPQEILDLPGEELAAIVLTGSPVVFRAGSAEVLGEFRVSSSRLIVELAQIEGGGEGVLTALWQLVGQYAARRHLEEVEWIVHAVHCARPNPKLRRVLERRGFVIREVEGVGPAYHLLSSTRGPLPRASFDPFEGLPSLRNCTGRKQI